MNKPPCLSSELLWWGETWSTKRVHSPGALLDILTFTGAGKGGRVGLKRRRAAEHEHCIVW